MIKMLQGNVKVFVDAFYILNYHSLGYEIAYKSRIFIRI